MNHDESTSAAAASAEEPERPHAHHFESLAKQEHALRLGMWVFLGSEILLFAGLFALYSAYRTEYSLDFSEAFKHNNIWIGTSNTALLIISSFTAAWSIHALRKGQRRVSLWCLAATIALGCGFLVLKGIEYSQHFSEGIFPGQAYHFAELPQHGAQIFFTMYYFMTGLHALHMVAGISLMVWVFTRVWRYKTTAENHAVHEMSALYWHMVDSIWIFLWPLFYLAG